MPLRVDFSILLQACSTGPGSNRLQSRRIQGPCKRKESSMYSLFQHTPKKVPWNKGKLVGQKRPLKLKEIWAIRIHLEIDKKHRDLALFNLAIDSKLRASDLLRLRCAAT